MTTARWMECMAENMEAKGDDPQVGARDVRAHVRAQDDQVKQWALKRLMELRSLEERAHDPARPGGVRGGPGPLPGASGRPHRALRAAGLRTDGRGQPLDPSDTPYMLVVSALGCDVTLHPASTVPRG